MTNHVTIEARALASAMKIANDIVERRNTIPILNCVRLTYKDSGLIIDATDLDLEASIAVDEIDGAGNWSACVPAKLLHEIAKRSGVMPLRLEPREETVTPTYTHSNGEKAKPYQRRTLQITAGDGDAEYSIDALDAGDYPELFRGGTDHVETFTNGALPDLLAKVSWCISTEETRYYLNGVHWEIYETGRSFQATDGHRAAVCKYAPDPFPVKKSWIIPRKTVAVICKHLVGKDVVVSEARGGASSNSVTGGAERMQFSAPGIVLRSKLIDGTFPDIWRVIPKPRGADILVRHQPARDRERHSHGDRRIVGTRPRRCARARRWQDDRQRKEPGLWHGHGPHRDGLAGGHGPVRFQRTVHAGRSGEVPGCHHAQVS